MIRIEWLREWARRLVLGLRMIKDHLASVVDMFTAETNDAHSRIAMTQTVADNMMEGAMLGLAAPTTTAG